MKRVLGALLFIAWIAVGPSCAATLTAPVTHASPTSGRPIAEDYFYGSLSKDGEWFQSSDYGWCWTPYDVAEDWRPYSVGHWLYSDYGWSWASDESFGWATYHYGRWFFDETYGWAWAPGSEWAPAWVAWRTGDEYVGWAPLPPHATWKASAGLTYGDGDVNMIPSNQWVFAPRAHVLDAALTLQLTSVARNVTMLGRSRDATRFELRNGHPANMGLDVAQLEVSLGSAVPRVRIVDVDSPARGGGADAGQGAIGYFRPLNQPAPAVQSAPRSAPVRRAATSGPELQRQRDEGGRKLESDLIAERVRLVQAQEAEMHSQAPGAKADSVRQRHADEQQAFEMHAGQQRRVLTQRIQKQIVRPGSAVKRTKGSATAVRPGEEKAKTQDKSGH